MNRRSLLSSLVVAAALLGCAPAWQVVAQTAPDPFRGQRRFAVLPIDYTGLRVGRKTEAEYLSAKTDKQRDSFARDKVAINDKFSGELLSHARDAGVEIAFAAGPAEADAPFLIQPSIAFLEPGFDVFVASEESRVEMSVKIMTSDGKVLDEVLLEHGTDSRISLLGGGYSVAIDPSSGGRLRRDGGALGKELARYLQTRVASSGG